MYPQSDTLTVGIICLNQYTPVPHTQNLSIWGLKFVDLDVFLDLSAYLDLDASFDLDGYLALDISLDLDAFPDLDVSPFDLL